MDGMMWGVGAWSLLLVVLLVLAATGLVRYLWLGSPEPER
jgi:hypothetical protein